MSGFLYNQNETMKLLGKQEIITRDDKASEGVRRTMERGEGNLMHRDAEHSGCLKEEQDDTGLHLWSRGGI